MAEITVTLQKHDRTAVRTDNISLDVTLGEVREAAQTLLGLPEKPPCRLVLYRTWSTLENNWTLEEAGIQQNDTIMLYPLYVWQRKNAKGHFFVHQAVLSPDTTSSDTESIRANSQTKATTLLDDEERPRSFSGVTKLFFYNSSRLIQKSILNIIRFGTKTLIKTIKKIYFWIIGGNLKRLWKRNIRKYFLMLLTGFLITYASFHPKIKRTGLVLGLKLGITKNAQGKNLSEVNLESANLTKVNMISANLNGSRLHQANLSEARLRKASLAGADLRGVNFSRADLTEANLIRANLLGANLRGANLRKATITAPKTGKITTKLDRDVLLSWEIVNKPITGRYLEGKKLDGFNLSHANLKSAILSRASLTWVDLSYAKLEGAILYKADLTGANLKGANLLSANLRGANLYKVNTDTSTICPNGRPGRCKF